MHFVPHCGWTHLPLGGKMLPLGGGYGSVERERGQSSKKGMKKGDQKRGPFKHQLGMVPVPAQGLLKRNTRNFGVTL